MLAGLDILTRKEGEPTHCGVVRVGRGSWFACRERRVKEAWEVVEEGVELKNGEKKKKELKLCAPQACPN